MELTISNNFRFSPMNKWGNKHLLLVLARIAGMVLLAGDLMFLFFLPMSVLYAEHQSMGLLILIAVFAMVPLLTYAILRLFKREALTMAIVSLFIVIPAFDFFQDYRKDKALNETGVEEKAIVTERKFQKDQRDGVWLIKCSFPVSATENETLYHEERGTTYKVGDTIGITYLKDHPKVYNLNY